MLFPIIGTCVLASPGGQRGFFQAWYGAASAVTGDPYELLEPTAYWYPSVDLNNTDRILGIASTNTANTASVSANGWEFNGTSQYLDMGRPTEIELNTNTTYSMAAWIYPNTTSFGAVRGVMGKTFAFIGDRWGFALYTSGGNSRHYAVVDDNGSFTALDNVISINSNTWYHFVYVLERGVSNGFKLYYDGVQIAQGTFNLLGAITYSGNRDVPFRFGSYNNNVGAPANFWSGYIDQAAIWNGRALTSNEVFQLFEDTKEGRK